jgi:hypothetical protein
MGLSSVAGVVGCGLPRVLREDLFVDVGTPAWTRRQTNVAVVNRGRVRHQLRLPGHVVNVDLHDLDVGQHRAEMDGVQVRQMTLVIVRGHRQLVSVGHLSDGIGLPKSIPRHVDNDGVHRV